MTDYERIDIDFLRSYNQPGPRYTSYPTAPLFAESFRDEEFEREVVETNRGRSEEPLSLYFHLPFCDELCYFCACTMIVTRKPEKKHRYLEALEREIDRVAGMVDGRRPVTQLHWGGGTPTDFAPDQIEWLVNTIRKRFAFVPEEEGEFSCEIDPRGLTKEHLEALRRGGFNRVSMGVQDFDPTVQVAVNRIQPETVTRDAVSWSRELGFKSVNLDFMYGLPHQSTASFERTLETLIDIAPERIAMFNFAYVPWLKKHQKQLIDPDTLPSPEERLQLLKMAIETLSAAGYIYIGMDHFSRPDDELAVAQKNRTLRRNFQGYSTHAGCDLYAFGMSGISQLESVYAQNHKALPEYYAAVDAGRLATACGYRLDADDHIRREVITRLMCDFELDKPNIESRFGIEFDAYFKDSVAKLGRFYDDGLLVDTPRGFEVTPMGRLVIRNIAMCFDRYLDDMRGDKPVFSRTV